MSKMLTYMLNSIHCLNDFRLSVSFDWREREWKIRDDHSFNILFMILKNDQCVKKPKSDIRMEFELTFVKQIHRFFFSFQRRMLNNCSLSKALTFFHAVNWFFPHYFKGEIDEQRIHIQKTPLQKNSRGWLVSFSFYMNNSINCTWSSLLTRVLRNIFFSLSFLLSQWKIASVYHTRLKQNNRNRRKGKEKETK